MSTEEQAAALGRIMLERSRIGRELSLVESDLRAFADALGQLTGVVNKRLGPPTDAPIPEFPASVAKYADLTKLRSLMEERDRLQRSFMQTSESLSPFNL
jgi:hypothetical protein